MPIYRARLTLLFTPSVCPHTGVVSRSGRDASLPPSVPPPYKQRNCCEKTHKLINWISSTHFDQEQKRPGTWHQPEASREDITLRGNQGQRRADPPEPGAAGAQNLIRPAGELNTSDPLSLPAFEAMGVAHESERWGRRDELVEVSEHFFVAQNAR